MEIAADERLRLIIYLYGHGLALFFSFLFALFFNMRTKIGADDRPRRIESPVRVEANVGTMTDVSGAGECQLPRTRPSVPPRFSRLDSCVPLWPGSKIHAAS